ncbi:hypothetical protein FRB99_000177 [Tulasnella sp. 403]|nr:hypothetical protein FRB99_000177 [Tulasnella sp. 403]
MAITNHMNVSQHHPKIGISLAIPKGGFVAGDEVRGKFTVESRTDKGLGLATISVELVALQELTSRDHAATSTFIHLRRYFQGHGLPISNAVQLEGPPDAPTLPREYHPARKGQTSFFFSFPLPSSAPSSISFGNGLAQVRYEIIAHIEVFWKGEKRVVAAQKPIDVVECLPQLQERPPAIVLGEGGKIHIQARLLSAFSVVGQTGCIELFMRNHSNRKTNGVTVTLSRRLHLANPLPQNHPLRLSDSLVTIPYHSPEYCVPPGGEGVAHLVFDIPKNAFGTRVGAQEETSIQERQKAPSFIFSVECEVNVFVLMGLGAKDIAFALPLVTAHPRALSIPSPQTVTSPVLPNGQVAYTPIYSPELDAPLEPPRPAFAYADQASTPPSPQFTPYLPTSVQPPSPFSPYIVQTPPNPYFPQYSSQPTTPSQAYYGYVGSPPQSYPVPPVPPPQAVPWYPQQHVHTPPAPQVATNWLPPAPAPHQPQTPEHLNVRNPPAGSPESPSLLPYLNDAEPSKSAETEGKGVIASRVARHLRDTSRARSVSPTSHRFPLQGARRDQPLPVPPKPSALVTAPLTSAPAPKHAELPQPTSAPLSQSLPSLPRPPPLTINSSMATGLTQPPNVLSPRPRPSPRISCDEGATTTANGIKVASIKSKPVEELERMAEQVLKEEREKRLAREASEARSLSADRSLVQPIFTGERVKARSQSIPHVSEIFKRDTSPAISKPYPTASDPSPIVSRPVRGGPSGLDALEKRLEASRPAILDKAEQWLFRGRRTGDSDSDSASRGRHRREPTGPRAEHLTTGTRKEKDTRSRSEPRKEVGLPPMPMPRPISPPEDPHEKEMLRLRKQAVQRVDQWADHVPHNREPSEHIPWATLSGQTIPKTSSGFVSTKKGPLPQPPRVPLADIFTQPEVVSAAVETSVPAPVLPPPSSSRTENTPLKAAAAAVSTPVITSKRGEHNLLSTPLTGKAGYDVRSARGGRGGVVSAVTALWENTAVNNPAKGPTPGPAAPAGKPRPPPIFKVPMIPASASAPTGLADYRKPPAPRSPNQLLSPAEINGTIAKPVLSSAASLVRPIPRRATGDGPPPPRIPTSPSAPRIRSQPASPQAEPQSPRIGVGQLKLKELIAKYQNA